MAHVTFKNDDGSVTHIKERTGVNAKGFNVIVLEAFVMPESEVPYNDEPMSGFWRLIKMDVCHSTGNINIGESASLKSEIGLGQMACMAELNELTKGVLRDGYADFDGCFERSF